MQMTARARLLTDLKSVVGPIQVRPDADEGDAHPPLPSVLKGTSRGWMRDGDISRMHNTDVTPAVLTIRDDF